jgi:hypothetical protein
MFDLPACADKYINHCRRAYAGEKRDEYNSQGISGNQSGRRKISKNSGKSGVIGSGERFNR